MKRSDWAPEGSRMIDKNGDQWEIWKGWSNGTIKLPNPFPIEKNSNTSCSKQRKRKQICICS